MVSAIEVNFEVVGSEKEDALDVDGAVDYFPARSREKIVIDGGTYDEWIAKGSVFADLFDVNAWIRRTDTNSLLVA